MARDYEDLVRKLYAKANAEGVTPAEKAECERLAKEYMMKHGVAHVLKDSKNKTDKIIHVEYRFKAPYADQKASLYNCMAASFNCRVVKSTRKGVVIYTLVGYQADYDRLEFLFKLILNQAFKDVTYAEIPHYENTRSFRISWWAGFTCEVVARLEESKKVAESEASSTGYALAIVNRDAAVDEKVKEMFPVLRKGKARSVRSYSGFASGRESGKRAEFYDQDSVTDHGPAEINSRL